ncbi:MAG: energy-coupling factor ABC transporter permease [Candidatus Omnitrophota bacterium]
MHIPDGFLSPNVWGSAWVVAVGSVGYCLKQVSRILRDKMIPLMGIMAAFIFAAQMINFPVMGGTSGHLLGGVLAAVLLGPYAGAIVIAIVLVVQCLIFQDGGLTALGANILNMAVVGAMGGYCIFNVIRNMISGIKGVMIGVFVSAWLSVVVASALCAVELAMSGTSPLNVSLPAMAGVHAVIGIGEGIISCLVIGFVLKVRPDLLYGNQA